MITNIVKTCEIELSPDELGILSKASDIIEKIVDTATDEDVTGFIIANNEDYVIDELFTRMVVLNDLSYPSGKLAGYYDNLQKQRGSVGEI